MYVTEYIDIYYMCTAARKYATDIQESYQVLSLFRSNKYIIIDSQDIISKSKFHAPLKGRGTVTLNANFLKFRVTK
jgi:hypothetical protein